jgi:hypothetical protein
MKRPKQSKGKRPAANLADFVEYEDNAAGSSTATPAQICVSQKRQVSEEQEEVSSQSSSESSSSSDSFGDYGTPIRSRQRFTTEETRILEEVYQKANRPSSDTKQRLAAEFDTTPQRIQIWYQNRRAKEKKTAGGQGSSGGMAGGSASHSSAGRARREEGESSRTYPLAEINERRKQARLKKLMESEKKKKRRVVEHDDDQAAIHLRSPVQSYATEYGMRSRSESPPPIYQSRSSRSTQYNPAMLNYPLNYPRTRHSDPTLTHFYQPEYDGNKQVLYTMAPSPTINPAEVGFPPFMQPSNPNEPYLPPAAVEQYPTATMATGKYGYKAGVNIPGDDSGVFLGDIAGASTSRQHQTMLLPSQQQHRSSFASSGYGESSSSSYILTNDGEVPSEEAPEEDAETFKEDKPRKGEC